MSDDLSNDEVNFIITKLALPDPNIHVAVDYSNQHSNGEVQAYAKLAGSTWTYYVRSLTIVIGRNASDSSSDRDKVQIDLGPSKVISRKHAAIQYNGNFWEITVYGRNGVKIDRVSLKKDSARLFSGNILDIGGVQMMFVLPDTKPHIAQAYKKIFAPFLQSTLSQPIQSYAPNSGPLKEQPQTQPVFHNDPHAAQVFQIDHSQYANSPQVLAQPSHQYSSVNPNNTPNLYQNQVLYPGQQSIIPVQNSPAFFQYHQSSTYPSDYQYDIQQPIADQNSTQLSQKLQEPTVNKQPGQPNTATKFISGLNEIKTAMDNGSGYSNISSYPGGKHIFAEPQNQGTCQLFDQDLSGEAAKNIKPPFSYATMISQAILSTEEHMMSLADIYEWIATKYAYYRYSKSGWQNSIRHNLSLSKAFEKVPRKRDEPGKGMKWRIVQSHKEEFCRKALQGDIIKGKSSNANRAFKRNAAAQAAKEAAANRSISEIVKGLEEKKGSKPKTSDTSFLGQPDTAENYPGSAQDHNNNKGNTTTQPPTVNNDRYATSTENPSSNITGIESQQVPPNDPLTSEQGKSQNSRFPVQESHIPVNTTTPRKLGSGLSSRNLSSSSKKLPVASYQKVSQNTTYSSPASALGSYMDQYPFASVSDIVAGTTLAALSTPSPTKRYANPNLASVETCDGTVNKMLSQIVNSSDPLFGFGVGSNNSNGLPMNTIGSMSTINNMSTMGVSPLEAYTPDRGGSANSSPNNSFKLHSGSLSATTPSTKLFFESASASKSSKTTVSSVQHDNTNLFINRDSPLKQLTVSTDLAARSSSSVGDSSQDLQSQSQGSLSPSTSVSTRPSSESSKNDSDESESFYKKEVFKEPNHSFINNYKREGNSTDISSFENPETRVQKVNTDSKTSSHEESSEQMSKISSSATTPENEKPNVRHADNDSVSLLQSNKHEISSDDKVSRSDDDTAVNPDETICEDPQTEASSPESHPFSASETVALSCIASASRTPAPITSKFQPDALSSAQKKQTPSSFLLSESPAPFWSTSDSSRDPAIQTPLLAGITPNVFPSIRSVAQNNISRESKLLSEENKTKYIQRKRPNEDADDINLGDEDSDNMGECSPSKTKPDNTPSVKRIRTSYSTQLSGQEGLLPSSESTTKELAQNSTGAEFDTIENNLNKSNQHDYSLSPTKKLSNSQISDATDSDPETSQNEENVEKDFKKPVMSAIINKINQQQQPNLIHDTKQSRAFNPAESSESKSDTGFISNGVLKTSSTEQLPTIPQTVQDDSTNSIKPKPFVSDDHKQLSNNEETFQAIQGLQTLRNISSHQKNNDDIDEGLGNLTNVDLTKSFQKIGRLAAAATVLSSSNSDFFKST